MPPLDAIPLRIDLNSPPILVDRIFPVETHETVPEYTRLARVLVDLARKRERSQRLIVDGQRLRAARLAAGLSTGKAADLLGISRARLWRIETGRERAPADAVERMEGR